MVLRARELGYDLLLRNFKCPDNYNRIARARSALTYVLRKCHDATCRVMLFYEKKFPEMHAMAKMANLAKRIAGGLVKISIAKGSL